MYRLVREREAEAVVERNGSRSQQPRGQQGRACGEHTAGRKASEPGHTRNAAPATAGLGSDDSLDVLPSLTSGWAISQSDTIV